MPSEKQQAIDNIGFGGIAKLIVQFSSKWWQANDKLFSFYWSEEDLKSTNYTDGMFWITQIRNMAKHFNNPKVWTVWISGDLVPEIEEIPVESLKRGLNYVLKKFLGKTYNVTKIDDILKSTWTSNENFLGSATFTKTGLYNENVSYFERLGEPLNGADGKPTLLFAVGGGPAGIAAATKLLENSITNITILEAENRIGGRIYSVKFGDAFVDVGAEYCHGEEGNVVYEMVKNLHILKHSKPVTPATHKLFYSNGLTIEPEIIEDLYTIIFNYSDKVNQPSNASLRDAFLSEYNSTILKKYKNKEHKLKIATEAIRLLENIISTHEGSFSLDRPAAGRHYEECDGDQAMNWNGYGYHIIFDILMYPYATQKQPIFAKINLTKKVTKIIWDKNKVTVKSSDNTSFAADYVIFTPSVGVLKEQHETLFEPMLPQRKQLAIKSFGFDAIIKIILHFPKKWWLDEDEMIMFLWKEEDLIDAIKEFPEGPSKDGISWVTHIGALVRVPGNPNVLIAWLSSDLVPKIEQTPEEIVLNGSMYVIRKFLGNKYNITAADKIIRSQWYSNPNFRGTYSYEKTGYYQANVSYQARLAEPLVNEEGHPAVLFAGEATSSKRYSTVHGAIESGRREANRIISLNLRKL